MTVIFIKCEVRCLGKVRWTDQPQGRVNPPTSLLDATCSEGRRWEGPFSSAQAPVYTNGRLVACQGMRHERRDRDRASPARLADASHNHLLPRDYGRVCPTTDMSFPSADAALTAAAAPRRDGVHPGRTRQARRVTTAPKPAAAGESEKQASQLPQPAGKFVPKPVNRSAYCACDHNCWELFGPSTTTAAPANQAHA